MADAGQPAETWASRSGFILATVGSAVGIGSIWKFPYEVGANGGGAFVLVYAMGLALVVVPLLFAELAIGRRGAGDAATSLATVAVAEGRSARWAGVGVLGALTSFGILSYYSVIGGWTLAYAVDTAVRGLPGADAAAVQGRFDSFLASGGLMTLTHGLFLAAVAAVVARGVQRGIERSMKVLMPLLGVLLVSLAVWSSVEGDAAEAARFLFVPDFGDLSGRAVLDALGLGFFSIGVGLGLMITYAAYSAPETDLREVAVVSVLADSAVSLVAGMAVFPIVFAHGLDPASGPGLVFVSLPLAFADLPGARVAAVAFFLLLFVAALASATSMLEAVAAVLGRRLGWGRRRAVAVAGAAAFVVGLITVGSFNWWADVHPLGFIDRYATASAYDLLDELTSNALLPLGGLALAIFAGWVTAGRVVASELDLHPRGSPSCASCCASSPRR
ncbi:MAG: sodium-dependent transporter [Acidimicrobiales bacterium]